MELQKLIPETVKTTKKSLGRTITASKSGTFVLSEAACNQLAVQEGDAVAVLIDAKGKKAYIGNDDSGFVLRTAKQSGLVFQSCAVFRNLAEVFGLKQTTRFVVVEEATKHGKATIFEILPKPKF